jgi:hypothetical protein
MLLQTSKLRPPLHPATPNSMNPSIQSWASLPDRIKQQAAPEMLVGAVWHYYGRPVERPSDAVLTRRLPPPVCPARRTNAEKRRDVVAALKVMPRASLRAVAKQTGTSHQFVANVRAGSKRRKSAALKEELSTSDGKALLPIVASNCGDSTPTNTNDQQRMQAMRNESDSSRIVAVDADEIGQRGCKTLPD